MRCSSCGKGPPAPKAGGTGAGRGVGLSSQPEWEDALRSLSRRGFGRGCSPLFIDVKAGFTLLELLFPPQLTVPVSFPAALHGLLPSPGSGIRSGCVLPYIKTLGVLPGTDSRQASGRVVTAGQGQAKSAGESLQNEQPI